MGSHDSPISIYERDLALHFVRGLDTSAVLARCIQSMQLTNIGVHAQGLYPEDDNDGHGSMYGSTRPILAPTRAEARPVFTREVSAERGVRLPGGSRLQGVTRVCIYLSEDTAYDVKPEPEKVPFSLQISLSANIKCYR